MRLSPFFVVVQIVALFKHIQVLIIKKCMNKLVSFIFKAEVLFFILIFYIFKYLYNKILGHENFVKIIKNAGGGWQFFLCFNALKQCNTYIVLLILKSNNSPT